MRLETVRVILDLSVLSAHNSPSTDKRMKKRRLDAPASSSSHPSISPHPTPPPRTASLAAEDLPPSAKKRDSAAHVPAATARSGPAPILLHPPGQSSQPTQAPAQPRTVVSIPTARQAPSQAKSRKDNLSAQLPLLPGRPVAFLQPKKVSGSSKEDEPGEEWILAKVVKCINGDRNRSVQSCSAALLAETDHIVQVRGSRC